MEPTQGRHARFMGATLPEPDDGDDGACLVWKLFGGQFREYSRTATYNRIAYQSAKVIAIVVAASVTICAAIGAPPGVTASLGGVIVVVEGLQQLFQWHANWIGYRRSAEQMRQHGLAFAAATTPYDGADRRVRLAAFMQKVALAENSAWAGRMQGDGSAGH